MATELRQDASIDGFAGRSVVTGARDRQSRVLDDRAHARALARDRPPDRGRLMDADVERGRTFGPPKATRVTGVARTFFERREIILLFLGLPQLAWIGFLAYLALRVVS